MRMILSIVFSIVCALIMAPASDGSPAQPYAKQKLTPAEESAIRKDVDSVPADGLPHLCVQDNEAAYRALLRKWGRTPQNSPAMYGVLDKLKASNWKFPNMTATGRPNRYGMSHAPDKFSVVHVMSTQSLFKNVTGLAFSSMFVVDSDVEKIEFVDFSIYTKDSGGLAEDQIADGSNPTDGDMRSMPVEAKPTVPPPNNPYKQDVIAIAHYWGQAGGFPFCWMVRMDRTASAGPVQVVLNDPTPGPNHTPPTGGGKDPVAICLNRGNPSEGGYCDYGPTEPNVSNESLNLLFPFSGSITLIDQIYTTVYNGNTVPARPDGTDRKPALLEMVLVKKEGGACDAALNLASPWAGFQTTLNTLKWQFADPGGDRTKAGNYLSAGSIGDCSDIDNNAIQDWYMVAGLYQTNGKKVEVVPVGLGSLESFAGQDSIKQFNPITYQWGCLITGSLITMADGSSLPVEKLKINDMVMGKTGKPLRVAGITPGYDKKFIKLLDDAGNSVVVTPGHPIATPNGMRMAKDLRAGDTIYGQNGPSKLRAAGPDDRKEMTRVYSVDLKAADGSSLDGAEGHAFYVGAILVGDYTAQGAVLHQAAADRMKGKK